MLTICQAQLEAPVCASLLMVPAVHAVQCASTLLSGDMTGTLILTAEAAAPDQTPAAAYGVVPCLRV